MFSSFHDWKPWTSCLAGYYCFGIDDATHSSILTDQNYVVPLLPVSTRTPCSENLIDTHRLLITGVADHSETRPSHLVNFPEFKCAIAIGRSFIIVLWISNFTSYLLPFYYFLTLFIMTLQINFDTPIKPLYLLWLLPFKFIKFLYFKIFWNFQTNNAQLEHQTSNFDILIIFLLILNNQRGRNFQIIFDNSINVKVKNYKKRIRKNNIYKNKYKWNLI